MCKSECDYINLPTDPLLRRLYTLDDINLYYEGDCYSVCLCYNTQSQCHNQNHKYNTEFICPNII